MNIQDEDEESKLSLLLWASFFNFGFSCFGGGSGTMVDEFPNLGLFGSLLSGVDCKGKKIDGSKILEKIPIYIIIKRLKHKNAINNYLQ